MVVHAGCWFTSDYFLLPMRNTKMTQASDAVVADITRENVREFPEWSPRSVRPIGARSAVAMVTEIGPPTLHVLPIAIFL